MVSLITQNNTAFSHKDYVSVKRQQKHKNKMLKHTSQLSPTLNLASVSGKSQHWEFQPIIVQVSFAQ